MAEYIERDKVIRELEWYIERFPDCAECLEARKHIIAYIPAADVRTVVTCGECIYFRLNSCMRWADGTFMERTDFCSRGAKREES